MARLEIIRPYVEKVVAEYLGVEKLVVHDDGSIPVQIGSASYFVRLLDGKPPMLQVYSPMVYEVAKSPELLDKLNDINAAVSFARAFWQDDQVIVATELVAETLDTEEIANACASVGSISDHYDAELQLAFGGKVMFPPPEEEKGPDDDATPGYV